MVDNASSLPAVREAVLQEVLNEVIEGLAQQGHIIIEGDKTYLPLKKTL